METITVAAARTSAFSVSDMEMLVGSALLIAALAWMVLAHLKRHRHRHADPAPQP